MDKAYVALDNRIVIDFHKAAKKMPEYPYNYGQMAKLRSELQELCGVTALEALNILTYKNVSMAWKFPAIFYYLFFPLEIASSHNNFNKL